MWKLLDNVSKLVLKQKDILLCDFGISNQKPTNNANFNKNAIAKITLTLWNNVKPNNNAKVKIMLTLWNNVNPNNNAHK